MSQTWMVLCFFLQGANTFLIHNIIKSQCLEDSMKNGSVQLQKCNLDSDLQQWLWRDPYVLENVATLRCLSAHHVVPVRTVSCGEHQGLQWACVRNRLVSRDTSLELTVEGKLLVLSHESRLSKWRSVDEGDICQEKLRSKRALSHLEDLDPVEGGNQHGGDALTEEQRGYLKWYYRTEDASVWTFAVLALAFGALLLGCLFFGMGLMANRSRKKIAKYKAAALTAKANAEELRVIAEDKQTLTCPSQDSHLPQRKALQANGDTEVDHKQGHIVVTWKDGNVSTLYPEAAEGQ